MKSANNEQLNAILEPTFSAVKVYIVITALAKIYVFSGSRSSKGGRREGGL